MVLFFDTEKKQQDARKDVSAIRRWVRRGFIILFVFAALFAAGLGILHMLSGQSGSLKRGVEQYLTVTTGLPATIGEFEYMELFPQVELNFKNVSLASPESIEPVVSIDSVYFLMDFWDLFFSRARLRDLDIENIDVSSKVTGLKPVYITRAHMTDNGRPPVFEMTGEYGGKAFTLTADVETKTDNGTRYFTASDTVPLRFESGFLVFSGHLDNQAGPVLVIDTLGDPEPLLKGRIYYNPGKTANKWDIDVLLGETDLSARIRQGQNNISGDVTADPYRHSDRHRFTRLLSLWEILVPADSQAAKTERAAPRLPASPAVDLNVEFRDVHIAGKSVGRFSFPLSLKDSVLKATSLKGTVADGALSGTIALDGASELYRLESDITWKDWDYKALQTLLAKDPAAEGEAVTEMVIKGEAATLHGLLSALNGEIVTIGGEGRMKSGILNLWGKGLLSTMFPSASGDLDLKINCLIADFVIEDGVATADPLFLDTKDVTMWGEGTIHLGNQTIDMRIRPESKGGLFTSSTAVNVSGNLMSPSVRPSTVSLGMSLGKLLLGTINPAFYAVSILDLGIDSGHPCYKYLSEDDKGEKTKAEDDSAANKAGTDSPADKAVQADTGKTDAEQGQEGAGTPKPAANQKD